MEKVPVICGRNGWYMLILCPLQQRLPLQGEKKKKHPGLLISCANPEIILKPFKPSLGITLPAIMGRICVKPLRNGM